MSSMRRMTGESEPLPGDLTQQCADITNMTDPHASGGIFLDGLPLDQDPEQKDNPIVEIYGHVRVGGGDTHYKLYASENAKPGLGLVTAGFGGILKSSEPLGKAGARQGLNTVVYDPIRRYNGSVIEDLTDPQRAHVLTIDAIAQDLRRNRNIRTGAPGGLTIVDQPKVIMAHSMGGLPGAIYAAEHPDDVEMLAMIHAVGCGGSLLGQIATSYLKGDIIKMIREEVVPFTQSDDMRLTPKNVLRALRYFGIGDPRKTRFTRPIGEGLSCLTGDVRPELDYLGTLGIARIYIDAENDSLVRPGDDIDDHVDEYIMLPDYGHFAPQTAPKKIIQLIIEARQRLTLAA